MASIDVKTILMIIIPFFVFLLLYLVYFSLKKKEKALIEAIHRNDDKESLENSRDIAEIINALRNDLNEQGLSNAIDALSAKNYGVFSENPVINSLINSKMSVCKDKGIDVNCSVINQIEKLKISEAVALIGNLFDNAIEACEICIQNGLEAKININSTDKSGLWILSVINSKAVEEKPVKTKFKTTKKDRNNHGLGMSIIREIVKRHKGIIKIKDEGNKMEIVVSV